MRKRIIDPAQQETRGPEQGWLNIVELADVEITSEDAAHPIESALVAGGGSGWRAAGPGKQVIRLLFTAPQSLRRIRLSFVETRVERTQEFVLRWSSGAETSLQEIVRQQWNFSPQGATCETEEYSVELPAVAVLELAITPDTSGGNAVASLAQFRLATEA